MKFCDYCRKDCEQSQRRLKQEIRRLEFENKKQMNSFQSMKHNFNISRQKIQIQNSKLSAEVVQQQISMNIISPETKSKLLQLQIFTQQIENIIQDTKKTKITQFSQIDEFQKRYQQAKMLIQCRVSTLFNQIEEIAIQKLIKFVDYQKKQKQLMETLIDHTRRSLNPFDDIDKLYIVNKKIGDFSDEKRKNDQKIKQAQKIIEMKERQKKNKKLWGKKEDKQKQLKIQETEYIEIDDDLDY